MGQIHSFPLPNEIGPVVRHLPLLLEELLKAFRCQNLKIGQVYQAELMARDGYFKSKGAYRDGRGIINRFSLPLRILVIQFNFCRSV